MINIIIFIILGIIQGLTEPLPISSSGHLLLFKEIFNTTIFNNLDLLIVLNFASFLAIFIIYFKDIKLLIISYLKYLFSKKDNQKYQQDYNYCNLLLISSIPTFIIGIIIKLCFEKVFNNILFLIITFLITAIILAVSSFKKGYKNNNSISIIDAIVIGLFQGIAVIPGISRSGMVLAGCLLCNIKKEQAIKYTFLLYFPVSIASLIFDLFTLKIKANLLPISLSFIICMITTYLSYKWLIQIVKSNKLWYFSLYCILLTLFIIFYFH